MKCLLLNNNRIVRIGESLELNLPRLDTLMLTNNSIQVAGVDTINLIMLYIRVFLKGHFVKKKMFTPPRNWGVPRKIISRRRG